MRVYADLHVHIGNSSNGKPIKITASESLNFENIAKESLDRKGIQIVGIVDCTSPYVINDIEKFLEQEDAIELEQGGIIYKNAICILLGSEIETTEIKEDGRKRICTQYLFFPIFKRY